MNKDLIEVIKVYGTRPHKELNGLLHSKSKDNLTAILVDLLTEYFNDKNSSTLREYLVVLSGGFEPLREKIGYNGYRQLSIKGKTTKEFCEAKPQNINTNAEKLKKLNGSGSFNDYSWEKLSRHKRENPTILVGGFIDGRLIYIFKFPFKSKTFVNKLKTGLEKHFPDGDVVGQYLRGATFSFNAYRDIKGLEVEVFVSETELKSFKNYITGGLYQVLEENVWYEKIYK